MTSLDENTIKKNSTPLIQEHKYQRAKQYQVIDTEVKISVKRDKDSTQKTLSQDKTVADIFNNRKLCLITKTLANKNSVQE